MAFWRWAHWLPEVPPEARLDLGAGETPLVRSRRVGPCAGLEHLHFKIECSNPTGSYKDRFGAMAISAMQAAGKSRCVATSSGNTGAALAAHCALAGMNCRIAIVDGTPAGKTNQMRAYGAALFMVRGFGHDAQITAATLAYLRQLGDRPDAALQVSAFWCSPVGMEGVRTISYELAEQVDGPIDHVFSPVGGGGLTLAVARGFEQLLGEGRIAREPRIHCVQPEGNDTVAGPLRAGADVGRVVDSTTQISGLQVPNIADGNALIPAARRTGGTGHLVVDPYVWEIQARLAREEGIYCEPAGAVAVAAALQARRSGEVSPGDRVVCLVTGSGYKDQHAVERMAGDGDVPRIEVSELLETMGG